MKRCSIVVLATAIALLSSLPVAVAAADTRVVTVSPSTVRAGDSITVVGHGFGPGNSVVVHWCFDGPLPDFPIVDDTGNFSLTVQVPATASPGATCIELPSTSLRSSFTIIGAGTSPDNSCAPLKFIGVHGTLEGPDQGSVVDAVWEKYAALASQAHVRVDQESAKYPQFGIEDLTRELTKVDRYTSQAAEAIAQKTPNAQCPQQRFILVGYSAGAWAIGRYLRAVPDEFQRNFIAGVYLLGDPQWPDAGIVARLGPAAGVASLSNPYIPSALQGRFVSDCGFQVDAQGGTARTYDPICHFDLGILTTCIARVHKLTNSDCPHFDYPEAADKSARALAAVTL